MVNQQQFNSRPKNLEFSLQHECYNKYFCSSFCCIFRNPDIYSRWMAATARCARIPIRWLSSVWLSMLGARDALRKATLEKIVLHQSLQKVFYFCKTLKLSWIILLFYSVEEELEQQWWVPGVGPQVATLQELPQAQTGMPRLVMIQQPGVMPSHPGSQVTVPLSSLQALQPVQSIQTGQPGCILVRYHQ